MSHAEPWGKDNGKRQPQRLRGTEGKALCHSSPSTMLGINSGGNPSGFTRSRGERGERTKAKDATETQRHRGKRRDPRHEVEGGPMRTRTSFSGPCKESYQSRESLAPPALEARLSLGDFLFRKRKSRNSPHGAGMQKTEREAIAMQWHSLTARDIFARPHRN